MNDRTRDNFDLDRLLHPAQAFEHPSDVVNDSDLTLTFSATRPKLGNMRPRLLGALRMPMHQDLS